MHGDKEKAQVDEGDKDMGATCAPPANSLPRSPSRQQEGGTEEETRTTTPPPTATPTLEAPPPPSKDVGMTATPLLYTTMSERYETNKHNILLTLQTHEIVITFVSMFCQAYKYSPDQSISEGERLSWPLLLFVDRVAEGKEVRRQHERGEEEIVKVHL